MIGSKLKDSMLDKVSQLIVVGALFVVGAANANQQIWQKLSPQLFESGGNSSHFQVDDAALRTQLSLVPQESTGNWSHQIPIPMPDGSIQVFRIVESPIVTTDLETRYPKIKTYKVRGVHDAHASGRIGITPRGLNGMIHTSAGVMYLGRAASSAQADVYSSRFRSDLPPENFSCGIHDNMNPVTDPLAPVSRMTSRQEGKLLRYDLAVAATYEYHQRLGGSIVNTMAQITMTIMRVNTIYERDLGITLRLVANNDNLIETDDKGQLNNDDPATLIEQTKSWIDNRLFGGTFAYDIGHMFSKPTIGGGLAYLGVVCDDEYKARAVSGFPDPEAGDPFDIDIVAHEIGHQFDAGHSFNGTSNSCGTGRNHATAFEPGSGSTVMAYAGICGVENLQLNTDATFHAGSIAEINSYTQGAGSCFVRVATTPADNSDPDITAISPRVIPANTPFILQADASDADNLPIPTQILSYQWDQMDVGCSTNAFSFGTDTSDNALFRSHLPRVDSKRNFPAIGTQVSGRFDKAEVLPCHDRDLNFRLTARDGSSGQATENIRVSVNKTAGPFEITNLNSTQTLISGTAFTVDWDVANTDLPPVNCANVDIDLLTFSATIPPILPTDPSRTYSIHNLATMIPNNGSAWVIINPIDSAHPQARIRLQCNDNIFYDISDADLVVVEASGQVANPLDDTGNTLYFPSNLFITDTVAPACGVAVQCDAPVVQQPASTASRGGSGAFDAWWLLVLSGIVALIRCGRRYSLQ